MVKKEKYADLYMGYCISLMEVGEKTYCLAASESRDGEILLIDTETNGVQKIRGLQGGMMNVIPVPEEQGAFLAIQKFYPIFDSKAAEIVYCKIQSFEGEELEADVSVVDYLPYVHRIGLTGEEGKRKIIAATLCHNKEYQDDWSFPGGVYEYLLDENMGMKAKRMILDGLHKNHGMFLHIDKIVVIYIKIRYASGVAIVSSEVS